ncbi:hypothetical protein LRP49_18190 [Enterovibrio sp. ZSDZ35]|uniref:PH domain-containing protein n=1 Tax=Enterovibrio qingdaonensis TaxID=2899818 RepID=A0ABT5QQ38_9GAMM|nr:hypothetical protein [Enterovibrio sp. ZSDZ35]MDD1783102.1 hypothetical protein [Enterovibrio sp. ZSDZ35]
MKIEPKRNRYLYLTGMEILRIAIGIPFLFLFSLFCLYAIKTTDDISPFLGLILSISLLLGMFWRGYIRSKFMRHGGYYLIENDHIKYVYSLSKVRVESIQNRKFKVTRRFMSFDIIFNDSIISSLGTLEDMSHFGSGIYGVSKAQKDEIIRTLSSKTTGTDTPREIQ